MEEFYKDLAELEALERQATRQYVKNALSFECSKLRTKLTMLQEEKAGILPTHSTPIVASSQRYEVKLNNNYAWDQSSKFVKFYLTLPKIQSIPSENISCTFTDHSLCLNVKDLENKDYVFAIKNLLYTIVPGESHWKMKTDMILINCAKLEQKHWPYVTETEKKTQDSKAKMPETDPTDPTAGLMSIMKNMYEQGDDQMKRSIAKAWHESQTQGKPF